MKRFCTLLREQREEADQSPQVMSLLLNISEDVYQQMEGGENYPDEETLKRLCVLLDWNYYETRRMINNEIAAQTALSQAPSLKKSKSTPNRGDTLGQRLRQVREETEQQEEIIAMLLRIDVDTYRGLENGDSPTNTVLRQISIVYDWNYQDLIALLRSEQVHRLYPQLKAKPVGAGSAEQTKVHTLLQELERMFPSLPAPDQQNMLAQLELISETARRRIS